MPKVTIQLPMLLLAALLALCSLTGCRTATRTPPPEFSFATTDWRPQCLLEYYPYPTWEPESALQDIRPIPAYTGWTDERMLRDIERFQGTAVSVIMLVITPQNLGQPDILTRVRRFYDLVAQNAPGLKIMLAFQAERQLKMPFSNVLGFMRKQGFLTHSAAWTPNNGPAVIAISSHLELSEERNSTDLTVWHFSRELPERPHHLFDSSSLATLGQCAWIIAADCGVVHSGATPEWQQRWNAPRRNGLTLKTQLMQAWAQRLPYIIIGSWNNYSDGSFLEPNSLDGEKLLDIIRLPLPDQTDQNQEIK